MNIYVFLKFVGIFAYLNYNTPVSRKQISDILINGLRRLEYRGYDSAGIAIDESPTESSDESDKENADSANVLVIRKPGKVEELNKAVTGMRGTFFQHISFSVF